MVHPFDIDLEKACCAYLEKYTAADGESPNQTITMTRAL
jgi:hypothetical protein